MKVLNTFAEDVMDISWSRDERRVVGGSLDHSVFVFEESWNANVNLQQQQQQQQQGGEHVHVLEGMAANGVSSNCTSEWTCVWRNDKEHTHYVQGVAYDPLGVYLASQGSDRTVRVWQRKRSGKAKGGGTGAAGKKKVLAAMDGNAHAEDKVLALPESSSADDGAAISVLDATAAPSTSTSASTSSQHDNGTLNNELVMGKFEVGKAKMLKYRTLADAQPLSNAENMNAVNDENAKPESAVPSSTKTRHLFADESTVESFFRRLAWTNDGAFLITPASLWHPNENLIRSSDVDAQNNIPSPTFATYLFARHQFDRPYKVLSGLEKPSVVVRPNPVLFQLPKDVASDLKENMKQRQSSSSSSNGSADNIPYRSIFAVLTLDSVLIYDTCHSRPLCIARGLHYAGLTDCSWSSNGRNLIVCSTDGYISIISFAEGELGDVYQDSSVPCSIAPLQMAAECSKAMSQIQIPKKCPSSILPPCEPGQSAAIVAPPSKRARTDDKKEKKRVVPMLLSTNGCNKAEEGKDVVNHVNKGHENAMETEEVVGAVTNLSIDTRNELQSNMNQIQPIC